MRFVRTRRRFGIFVTGALVISAVLGGTMGSASAWSPNRATVSGPVTGGAGQPAGLTTLFDLSQVGYQESEYFLSGTAKAYTPTAPLTQDGRWSVAPTSEAPFTTRLIVHRPSDPSKFNGTVFVEWLNVSIGSDVGIDWAFGHNELIRRGYAWVGVSAQTVGINADKAADPVRYASLVHPGDSYSYDMFTQAGRAVRTDAAQLLGGLRPRHVIADGESQSAGRMVTYINAIQPLAHAYDGFLVHSRGASGAPVSQAPLAAIPTPPISYIRTDGWSPTLVLQSETDVNEGARQPDSRRYRLWEMAGTSHVDAYTIGVGLTDNGDGQAEVAMFEAMRQPPGIGCGAPMNTGPSHLIVEAAMRRLYQWVNWGTPPPLAPRLEVASFAPTVYVRDGYGNVRGGIRTPHVDTPVAIVTNAGQSGAGLLCRLTGATFPYDPVTLGSLYSSHDNFVWKWRHAMDRAVRAGFVLWPDAQKVNQAAVQSTVPG